MEFTETQPLNPQLSWDRRKAIERLDVITGGLSQALLAYVSKKVCAVCCVLVAFFCCSFHFICFCPGVLSTNCHRLFPSLVPIEIQ